MCGHAGYETGALFSPGCSEKVKCEKCSDDVSQWPVDIHSDIVEYLAGK